MNSPLHLEITIVFVALSLLTAVMIYYGIRHFQDVRRVYATIQNAMEAKALLRRRALTLVVATVPILVIGIMIPDPWPSQCEVEVLDKAVQLTAFDAASLAATPPTAWHKPKNADLKFLPFGRKHVVLRARIPQQADGQRYVAEILYPFVAKADFILVQGESMIKEGGAGLDAALDFSMHRGLHYTFDIPTATTSERMLYANIAGNGLLNASLKILRERDHASASALETSMIALTVGAFIGIFFYNLAMSISLRERIYVEYLIYQVIMLAFMFGYTGMAVTLIPSLGDNTYHPLSLAQHFLLLVMMFPLSNFYLKFIFMRENFPWGYRGFKVLTIYVLVSLPFILFADLSVVALLTLPFLSIAITSAIVCIAPIINHRPVFYLELAVVGLGVSTIVHVLGVFGIIPSSMIIDFFYGFGSVWETLFLSLAIGDKINLMREERQSIEHALHDKSGMARVNQLLGQSFSRNYVPREWNVSILFVTVADFTRFTDRMPTADLYDHLSKEMLEISRIVKEFNGAIDRALGDGLLCYFGYERIGSPKEHARDAYRAARRIQQRSVEHLLDQGPNHGVVFPLCIGINAANVLVANLSSDAEKDFTMIGSGVILASRMNAVCSPFRIIISSSFHDLLDQSRDIDAGVSEIYVSIKHQADLVRAYECNPFLAVPDVLAKAERAYLELMGYSRKEGRFRLKGQAPIALVSALGRFQLSDFSLGGLGMVGSVLISQKSILSLQIVSDNPPDVAELKARMLTEVQAEVRWCRSVQGRFEHGLRFVGLNDEQKELLFNFFSTFFKRMEITQTPNVDADNSDLDVGA